MTEEIKDEIEIDLNQPVEGADKEKEAAPVVQKAAPAEKTSEEGIEELKSKLDAEKQARFEAQRQAQQAQQFAQRASVEVEDTNLHLVNSAIETVKQQSFLLEQQMARAYAAQDFAEVAKVQRAMTGAEVKLSQLEAGKEAMENRPKAQPVQPVSPSSDPVEDIARQVTPQSAQWLRQNKSSLAGPRAINKMFRAHEDAVDDGIPADTPEYFRFIESRLGIGSREHEVEIDVSTAASTPTQRRTPPPAAPVSRSGTGNGSRSNVVRLTADERDMASSMGMSERDYALNKQALQREGKLQ